MSYGEALTYTRSQICDTTEQAPHKNRIPAKACRGVFQSQPSYLSEDFHCFNVILVSVFSSYSY